ncbi:hypothetical protein PC121_g15214 [Phytophthora cactorum]|nr:hypothetical protein PC120_g13900 [Phytophthora cactorum]KAG3056645.1 hypothetical protein PC121_g15214 [Phytophthora cactorum]
MRLHCTALLLIAALISVIGADTSVSTSAKRILTQPVVGDEKNFPVRRVLRSSATAVEDDEEERGFFQNIIKRFKPKTSSKIHPELASKATTNLATKADDAATMKVAFQKYELNMEKSDDLISSQNFKFWFDFFPDAYKHTRGATRTKFLQKKFDEMQVIKMVESASKSEKADVKKMGDSIALELMKEWTKLKPIKTPEEVTGLSKLFGELYGPIYTKALAEAAKNADKSHVKLPRTASNL